MASSLSHSVWLAPPHAIQALPNVFAFRFPEFEIHRPTGPNVRVTGFPARLLYFTGAMGDDCDTAFRDRLEETRLAYKEGRRQASGKLKWTEERLEEWSQYIFRFVEFQYRHSTPLRQTGLVACTDVFEGDETILSVLLLFNPYDVFHALKPEDDWTEHVPAYMHALAHPPRIKRKASEPFDKSQPGYVGDTEDEESSGDEDLQVCSVRGKAGSPSAQESSAAVSEAEEDEDEAIRRVASISASQPYPGHKFMISPAGTPEAPSALD
jgi:hypothetical protein